MSKNDCPTEGPFWYDGKFLIEVGFCEDFLQKYPMVCVSGSFFTKEGRVADEEGMSRFGKRVNGFWGIEALVTPSIS